MPFCLELLTVNRSKHRTGHDSFHVVNCHTLMLLSGWTVCLHAHDNNRQLTGSLQPVGLFSVTSTLVTVTDISHMHLIDPDPLPLPWTTSTTEIPWPAACVVSLSPSHRQPTLACHTQMRRLSSISPSPSPSSTDRIRGEDCSLQWGSESSNLRDV